MGLKEFYRQRNTFPAELISAKRFYLAWVLLLFAVCMYMWQWYAMPVFPDEVAFMMNKARFFYDGGALYASFPICESNARDVPLFFYPAAAFVGEINSLPYWPLIRIVPFVAIAALMAAVFTYGWKTGKSIGPALLFAAAFAGVAGSGLILSRPEPYLILHGAACLFVYSYCAKEPVSRRAAIALLLLLGIVSNISFFVHPQGLIFAPLTLMLMYRISAGSFVQGARRLAVGVTVLYSALAVWYGIRTNHVFRCTESRAITDFVHSMTLPGWLKSPAASGIPDRLKGEFFVRYKYFDKFDFASNYQIGYLPPTHYPESAQVFFHGLKIAVDLTTAIILLAFLSLSAILLVRVCLKLYGLRREPFSWTTRILSFAVSNDVMFFTICWAHLGLLFIVTQINFYRAFYLNLAMVVLLVIALHQAKNKIIRKSSLIMGLASLSLCGVSTVVAGHYIAPQLKAGYAGPSIPLATNWHKVEADVQALAKQCGVADDDTRIIVDDMTYDALKKHRRIFPITYIGLSGEIMGKPVMAAIEDINATAAIARCDYFEAYKIPYSARLGGLCGAAFKKGAPAR